MTAWNAPPSALALSGCLGSAFLVRLDDSLPLVDGLRACKHVIIKQSKGQGPEISSSIGRTTILITCYATRPLNSNKLQRRTVHNTELQWSISLAHKPQNRTLDPAFYAAQIKRVYNTTRRTQRIRSTDCGGVVPETTADSFPKLRRIRAKRT